MSRKFSLFVLVTLIAALFANKIFSAEQGYKLINGVNHFYKIVGDGEPYIVLHGGPGMYHDELYPFFLDFAKKHKVIFYDQRGNGKSTMETIEASNFSEELLVEDLESLRRELRLGKVNIIGHSWGGLLAIYYATQYPDNVDRLILIDAAPVNSELLMKSYFKQISMMDPAEWKYLNELWESEAYRAGDPKVHNEAMRINEGAIMMNKAVIDKYMAAAAFSEVTAKNAVKIQEQANKMKRNIRVQSKLGNIKSPTLLIKGEGDMLVDEAIQLANKLIANSEVRYIKEAGHYPHIEQPELLFGAINAFIEKTNR